MEARSARYSHTQKSPLCLILYITSLACLLVLPSVVDIVGSIVCMGLGLIFAIIGAAFHHLTVEDWGAELSIRFGPIPAFRRTVRYNDIDTVEVGRTLILDGWGIHYSIRGGWVWNIWGLDCVRIRFLDGRILRIGTDDAEGLSRFLNDTIRHVY